MSTEESEVSADLESRARKMGWLPEDREKGPKEHWVDAETYVKRGEEILPLLPATNKKLTDRIAQQEQSNANLVTQLAEAKDAIEALKESNSAANKERVKDQKQELLTALAAAKKDGDVDQEVALTDQLSELNVSLREAAQRPAERKSITDQPVPQLTPAARQWMADNPWFGQDKRRTGLAMGLADEYKSQGGVLGTPEHFEFIDQEMDKMFDGNAARRERGGKTEGVTTSTGGGGGGGSARGHSFADLPQEAQKACRDAADRLVGPAKKYKTLAEWQKRYVDVYDWST